MIFLLLCIIKPFICQWNSQKITKCLFLGYFLTFLGPPFLNFEKKSFFSPNMFFTCIFTPKNLVAPRIWRSHVFRGPYLLPLISSIYVSFWIINDWLKVFIIQKFTFSIITEYDSDGYTHSHQNQIFSNIWKRPNLVYYSI